MIRKTFIVLLVILAIIGGIAYHQYRIPPGPARNLTELEPVVLSVTSSLGAFLIGITDPASRTVKAFSLHTLSTKPKLSYVFASFSCDIRSQGRDGIFIIKDKISGDLLFEDGTWPASPSLDTPHWRIPNLPRLEFPLPATGGH